jgi:hypothetical protein
LKSSTAGQQPAADKFRYLKATFFNDKQVPYISSGMDRTTT